MASLEEDWLSYLKTFSSWEPDEQGLVVVSPHPDDEVLGAGGLIASHLQKHLPVTVVAVTDGEAAYADVLNLAAIRRREQENALSRLGFEDGLIRLGFPDGRVESREKELAAKLSALLGTNTYLVAPWARDPHPDHEACGRAAEVAARASGATLLSYFFWTWNRFEPHSVEELPFRKFELSPNVQQKKAAAIKEYRSQLECENGEPILPPNFLLSSFRPFEALVIHGA